MHFANVSKQVRKHRSKESQAWFALLFGKVDKDVLESRTHASILIGSAGARQPPALLRQTVALLNSLPVIEV